MKYFYIYLIFINIIGYFVMAIDKQKAKKHLYRIPEANIFLIAAAFGSLGVLSGMYSFRHKTKHLKFLVGIPAILVLQSILIINLLKLYA